MNALVRQRIKLSRIKLYFKLLLRNKSFKAARRTEQPEIPAKFRANNLQEVLRNYGMNSVKTIDLFDNRADLRLDMNASLPSELIQQFNTVIDIGTIEHVFDTKQALSNLMGLVGERGHLLIHTPCKGYFNHGFHTFSPECLLQALELNGFSIKYLKFSTPDGIEIENPGYAVDALIWIVAERLTTHKEFIVPQQGRWKTYYE
jgi:hypothetical protein